MRTPGARPTQRSTPRKPKTAETALAGPSDTAALSPANVWRIGTAGWTVPKAHAELIRTPAAEEKRSHLERYAQTFNCAEVNSSFHRPHRRTTWERWAAATPADFLFSVKVPKAVTHTAKLLKCGAPLQEFFDQVSGLGSKLGVLLVQLPPSLAFEEGAAHEFFTTLRELHSAGAGAASVALEARHASWFTAPVDRLLRGFEVARVAADPPKGSPLAAKPSGWRGLRYFRMHGVPRTYYSEYGSTFTADFAETLREENPPGRPTWVMFDNTALGHATSDAFSLRSMLS